MASAVAIALFMVTAFSEFIFSTSAPRSAFAASFAQSGPTVSANCSELGDHVRINKDTSSIGAYVGSTKAKQTGRARQSIYPSKQPTSDHVTPDATTGVSKTEAIVWHRVKPCNRLIGHVCDVIG